MKLYIGPDLTLYSAVEQHYVLDLKLLITLQGEFNKFWVSSDTLNKYYKQCPKIMELLYV